MSIYVATVLPKGWFSMRQKNRPVGTVKEVTDSSVSQLMGGKRKASILVRVKHNSYTMRQSHSILSSGLKLLSFRKHKSKGNQQK